MGSKFKTPPKTMTDKTVPAAITKYEKLNPSDYKMRVPALKLVVVAVNNVKKTPQPPDVQTYLAEVLKTAEAERKGMELQDKAMTAGLADGTARKVSQAPRYAGAPEVLKAYNQGFAAGLKIPSPAVMKAR